METSVPFPVEKEKGVTPWLVSGYGNRVLVLDPLAARVERAEGAKYPLQRILRLSHRTGPPHLPTLVLETHSYEDRQYSGCSF